MWSLGRWMSLLWQILLIGRCVVAMRIVGTYMDWSPYPGNDFPLSQIEFAKLDTLHYGTIGINSTSGRLQWNDK
jgi:GH18 family chitinase